MTQRPVTELPELVWAQAAVALPIGAVVTDTGHVFSLAPVRPTAQPYRLRCGLCPWQATTELRDAADAALRHADAHEHESRAVRGSGGVR